MRAFILVYCIVMALCGVLIVLVEMDEAGEEEAVASLANAPMTVASDAGAGERISAFDDFARVLPGLHGYDESEHFIFWTTLDQPEPGWATLAEDAVGYVCGRLRVDPSLSKAAVFFVRTEAEVQGLAGHLRPGARHTGSVFFSKVPAIVILVGPRVAGGIIHETTHYVVGGVAAGLPSAIGEGIATFVTEELLGIKGFSASVERAKRRRARRLAGVQDLPFLRELVTMSYDEFHEEEAGYQLAWCLGQVLLDRKSGRLRKFLEEFDGTDAWTSLARAYPMERIESEWEAEFFWQRMGK